jgi:hypothetical protein
MSMLHGKHLWAGARRVARVANERAATVDKYRMWTPLRFRYDRFANDSVLKSTFDNLRTSIAPELPEKAGSKAPSWGVRASNPTIRR